ncbi:23051_t:CDS:2 [Gigaspora rosea]|nr:23051_t:CDS:2 [Gigaspora rosea]
MFDGCKSFCKKKAPNLSERDVRSCYGNDLEAIIANFGQATVQHQKALSLKKKLDGVKQENQEKLPRSREKKASNKTPFSSYHGLGEVLKKHNIDGNGLTAIPQFQPATSNFDEDNLP